MNPTKHVRGYGPCLSVHQTYSHAQQIAIENTGPVFAWAVVHLNEFSWTGAAMHEEEGPVCA
jgi:hypothetical protein